MGECGEFYITKPLNFSSLNRCDLHMQHMFHLVYPDFR